MKFHKLGHVLALVLALLAASGRSGSASLPPEPPSPGVPPAISGEMRPKRARLLFVGDLMVHQPQIDRAYRRKTKDYSFIPAFEKVKKYVTAADLAVGNFETTLGGPKAGYRGYPCFSAPDAFADALADVGFDVLSTANNHCMDRRFPGLVRTLAQLKARSLDAVGTYAASQDRETVLVRDVNGIKVAFLAWTYGLNGFKLPKGLEWGAALLVSADEVSRDMARARALSPDFIVAMPHIGTEYVLEPPQFVIRQVDRLLEWGAGAVIASHPHVVQPMELRLPQKTASGDRPGGFVAWSMGNFISSQRTVPRDMGVMVQLDLEKSGDHTRVAAARAIPTWVQERPAKGPRVTRVLPLTEALVSPDLFALTLADVKRLKSAHKDFTLRVLSADVPIKSADLSYDLLPSSQDRFPLAPRKSGGSAARLKD